MGRRPKFGPRDPIVVEKPATCFPQAKELKNPESAIKFGRKDDCIGAAWLIGLFKRF
jgi:hypothetical protein